MKYKMSVKMEKTNKLESRYSCKKNHKQMY
jgi:hypothetical protein